MKKQIYVVLSQTGTMLSRIIKWCTGDTLNHSSISFEDDFKTLYSYGRRRPRNPFLGGFVMESPDFGTFRRFRNTEAVIFSFDVDPEVYTAMVERVETMYVNRHKYHYNYLGLFLATFHIEHHAKHKYYCSEFVAKMLTEFGIVPEDTFGGIIKPMDLFALPGSTPVYVGKLSAFRTRHTIWDVREWLINYKRSRQ